jgi:hypothetical protein
VCSFVGLPCNSSFTCLSKSPINKPLLQVSPTGTLRTEMPITWTVFFISLGVRNEQGLPSVSVPGKGAPPPYFPDGDPMERDALLQSLLVHFSRDATERALQIITCLSQVPGKWAPPLPPSRYPSRATYGETCPFPEPYFTHLFSHRKKIYVVSGLPIPFSPGAVCKSDKPLDVPRTFGPRIHSFLDRKVAAYNGRKLYLCFKVTFLKADWCCCNTNSLSSNKCTVLVLCIALPTSSYMFRRNCYLQGAYTYVAKTYSDKIVLHCFCISNVLIIFKMYSISNIIKCFDYKL